MKFFVIFAVMSLLPIIKVSAMRNYQQWQCSLPTQESIFSVVAQNLEAFQLYDNRSWLMKKRKYVSCFQKGLKVIPAGIATDVEILNLSQNSITRIWKADFKTYPSLVAISILNNCIEIDFHHANIPRCTSLSEFSIEAGTFLHLKNLKYLALSGNVMQHLPEQLPNSILVLFASFSSLKPINKKEMDYLDALEIISLSTNCITGDLKHLCRGNFTINESIFAAPNLKYLDLSYNNFKQIPSYLFQQSLLGIKLRGNPFHQVPNNSFLNATNVIYLNMAWTCQYVGHMQPLFIEKSALDPLLNLTTLDLSGNMITSLPDGFLSKNLKLVALNLELNCLINIEINPIVLPQLPLLKVLYLAGNSFCNHTLYPNKPLIPKLETGKAYLNFRNLTTLALGRDDGIPGSPFSATFSYLYFLFGVKFDEVASNSLNTLKELPIRQISFVGCEVRILNTSSFSGFNLTYLDLSSNHIGESSIYDNNDTSLIEQGNPYAAAAQYLLSKANDIKYYSYYSNTISSKSVNIDENVSVMMSKNGITNLKEYPLHYFRLATHIDLSHNHITYISSNMFQHLQLLQVLNLEFNPIRRIHPAALLYLVNLFDLKLNISSFQEDITLDFLRNVQQNLTLQFGDPGGSFYRLLQFYGGNSIYFPNVTNIDISGIPVPPFYVSTNQVIFKPLINLKILIMNQAGLAYKIQSNFFDELPYLQHLSMRDSWLEEFPSEALQNMTNLIYLDLSYNQIETLALQTLPTFPKLETLLLSHNFIYEIEPGTLQFLQKGGLQTIDLSFNRIWHIGPTIIDREVLTNLKYLDIRGSYVECVCSLDGTFGWLVNSGIRNHSKLPGFVPQCSSVLINYYGGCIACSQSQSKQSAVNPTSLFTYVVTNDCHEHFLSLLTIFFTLAFILFIALALTTTSLYLKKKLTNFLLNDIRPHFNFSNEDMLETDLSIYAYDGFVFFDKENNEVADWLEVELIPRLENGDPAFKICVVGKEDWCGSTQVQQILLRIKASRKTIVIISDKFTFTPECQYVLSVLEDWIFFKKKEKGIIVTFGKQRPAVINKLQKCKPRNTYSLMHYSTINVNPLFWTSLKNSLISA